MSLIPVRHITSAPGEPAITGRFCIRKLEDLLKGGKLVHPLHKHDFYFLLAVRQGSGTHEIDFTPYPIQDHSLFLLRPGQAHLLELSADCEGFILEFDGSIYLPNKHLPQRHWLKARGKQFCAVAAQPYLHLHSILDNLHQEFTLQQEGYREAILAYLDLFFISYIRQSRNPDSVATYDNGYQQDQYDQFMHLLETNIARFKSTSQYAELLHLSPYQLNAITKATVGKTVSELINDQLILEAKRYLLTTHHQVKDIADQLGYEDISYFIRFFKKHTGSSPDAFRKNLP